MEVTEQPTGRGRRFDKKSVAGKVHQPNNHPPVNRRESP